LILLLLSSSLLSAQNKYEKEYRIKAEAAPEKAVAFVEAMKFSRKIKWYREEGIGRFSIEAKTKHRGDKYSIEFDLQGEIEDIERDIKWKEIPEATRSVIADFLAREHQKTRLHKIQIQYSGEREALLQVVSQPSSSQSLQIKYEIVLAAKTNDQYQDWEYLFSEQGEQEKKAIIIPDNTDHLLY
jgi:hypothetical protein